MCSVYYTQAPPWQPIFIHVRIVGPNMLKISATIEMHHSIKLCSYFIISMYMMVY